MKRRFIQNVLYSSFSSTRHKYVTGLGSHDHKGLLSRTEPGADPGVQAVSPQVTISHPAGGRLPLLSTRPAVTFPATQHHSIHCPLAGTKLYCLVTGT